MNIRIAIYLTLTLLIGAVKGHAQQFVDLSPASTLVETELHLVGGGMSMQQDFRSCYPQIQNINTNPGASLGIGAKGVLGIREYLGIGVQLDLLFNNYNIDMSMIGDNSRSMSAMFINSHFYTVSIPVFASARFNVAHSVRWNVDLGLYYAYGIGGTQRQRIYRAEINALDELVPEIVSVNTPYYHSSRTLLSPLNRGDIGLHVATSLNFGPHLSVGINLQQGIKNQARNPGTGTPHVRNFSFHCLLGYRF